MITKARDLARTSGSNLRGGNGTIDMLHIIKGEESFGTGRLFALATLPPGASIGAHKHEGEYEIYYILQGTAHVMDNDVPGVLETGDCMVCKDGDSHSIENRGDIDVQALFLVINTR
jgi:mannose-6-phosphate isomerase-like protein (cupin superfamily)